MRWLLIDEYQDIGHETYKLICAISGRHETDEDGKIHMFAVGDDDQGIYGFTGASIEYIQRFKTEFGTSGTELLECYRSSAHIVACANALAMTITKRMKTQQVKVDRARKNEPHGGQWEKDDPEGRGRVTIIKCTGEYKGQAMAAINEMVRLSARAPQHWDWRRCAVISRTWDALEPVESFCLEKGISTEMWKKGKDRGFNLSRLREVQETLEKVEQASEGGAIEYGKLKELARESGVNRWGTLIGRALMEYAAEHEGKTPHEDGPETADDQDQEEPEPAGEEVADVEDVREWVETRLREMHSKKHQGLVLTTAHQAKGSEFDHVAVLDAGWDFRATDEDAAEKDDEERRCYYVAMTRARETLTLLQRTGSPRNAQAGRVKEMHEAIEGLGNARTLEETPDTEQPRWGEVTRALPMREIWIGWTGWKRNEEARNAIRQMKTGDRVTIRKREGRWWMRSKSTNEVVGAMAKRFTRTGDDNIEAKVHAIVKRRRKPEETDNVREWEIIIPEM